MSDEQEAPKPEEAGTPAWVMTFADLMSLLMCFFVLLLSFSQMDLLKFKQVAGSMEKAFGVQRVVKVMEIPKGTSIIAKEFSPGKPEPTIIKQIFQSTVDNANPDLQTHTSDGGEIDASTEASEKYKKTEADARKLAELLAKEIEEGLVEVETKKHNIIVRVLERGSFPSGSATLWADFTPVLSRIGQALNLIKGDISVSGHTDDQAIHTKKFSSNWELSAARAVSVAHELFEEGDVNLFRLVVQGYAETKPVVDNDTAEHRARNRRVEIEVNQGGAQISPRKPIYSKP